MIKVYIAISHRFDCIKGLTEQSILANTNEPVNIEYVYPTIEEGCTGFSNVRYGIRKGIYLDPDMIVLGDIAELWSYHREGKYVCMKDGATEVAVIDCEHDCKNKYEEGKLPKACIIPLEWNVEDCDYRPNQKIPSNTKLLHFTTMKTQPWFFKHPHEQMLGIYNEYISRVQPNIPTLENVPMQKRKRRRLNNG